MNIRLDIDIKKIEDIALDSTILDDKLKQVEDNAKNLCPVDTGNLRDSIHIEKDNKKVGYVVADADYAVMVELGTINQSPQSFLVAGMIQSS